MKVAHIVWEDPCRASEGWMNKSEFDEFCKEKRTKVDSVGILFSETNEYYILVQSIGFDCIAECIKITKSAVLEVKFLHEIPIEMGIKTTQEVST